MTPPAALLILTACVLGAGCATTRVADPDPMARAIGQPMHDLSLVQETLPEVLTRNAATPYALAPNTTCANLDAEIEDLNAALGPDVDSPDDVSKSNAAALLASAVPGIPFRGIVREMTGAARRDRVMQQVVLAGVARRGFLKGAARERHCAPKG